MNHEMKLLPDQFADIVSGTKHHEFRLYDEKRQKISVGDRITFRKLPDLSESILVEVTSLRSYPDFSSMYEDVRNEYPEWKKEDWVNGMYTYYTSEDEQRYGALTIGIKKVWNEDSMDQAKPHAVVVGGTGMLRDVCKFLVHQGYRISVVARHAETLNALVEEIEEPASIHTIALDWNNAVALHDAINAATQMFGPVTLTIAWIHRTAPQAPLIVAKLTEGDFFHIRPRSVLDPHDHDPVDVRAISELHHIKYHQIILGAKSENGHSRWLTNKENI